MRKTGSTTARSLGAILAVAAGLIATRPAAACTHEVWSPDAVAGNGVALFLVDGTPFQVGPDWRIEVCFAFANLGGAAQTASAEILAWDHSDTGSTFPITGAHDLSITPGAAIPADCSIGAGNVAELKSVGSIPPNQLTDLCCFEYAALAPGTCAELPGQPTTVVHPNWGPYTVRDRAQVMMEVGGLPVVDQTITLNGYDGFSNNPISGPACGLLGLELVAPLGLALARSQRARRRRERAR